MRGVGGEAGSEHIDYVCFGTLARYKTLIREQETVLVHLRMMMLEHNFRQIEEIHLETLPPELFSVTYERTSRRYSQVFIVTKTGSYC